MIGGIFAALEAKGNGFAVGEVTGRGCERWHVFLFIHFARARLARDGSPL